MRRPSPLVIFGLSAFAWMVVLTLAWTKVSPWTSYPVTGLAQWVLEQGAPDWVRSVRTSPGHLEVDTRVAMPVASAGGRLAEATVEIDPGRYAYGLPVFLALLFAARGRGQWRGRGLRAVAGYVLLLPFQTFSAVMWVLMQIALYAQTRAQVLGVAGWQVEAVVYGYQLGSLVLPTLVPILLWLWLDRAFFNAVIVPGWQGIAGGPAGGVFASEVVAEPAAAVPPATEVTAVRAAIGTTPATESPVISSPPVLPSGRGEISSSASAGLPPRR